MKERDGENWRDVLQMEKVRAKWQGHHHTEQPSGA